MEGRKTAAALLGKNVCVEISFAESVASQGNRPAKANAPTAASTLLAAEDNGLELGRVSRRRVKIGLRLAGSHYNNYGRAAGKLHASVPLTVSPG